jgi:hypothetical protein
MVCEFSIHGIIDEYLYSNDIVNYAFNHLKRPSNNKKFLKNIKKTLENYNN